MRYHIFAFADRRISCFFGGRAENNYRFLLFADSCFLFSLIYSIAYPTENLPYVSLRFFSFRKPADSPVSDRQKAGFIKTSAQPQTRSEKILCIFTAAFTSNILYIWDFRVSEKKFPFFESSQESKRNRSPYLLNYKHKEKKESHSSVVRYNKNERTKLC